MVHHGESIRRPIAPRANVLTTELNQTNTELLLRGTDSIAELHPTTAIGKCYSTTRSTFKHQGERNVVQWGSSWCRELSDRSVLVHSLNYFSFQLMCHNWRNKHRGIYYLDCGIVNTGYLANRRGPLISGGSGFPVIIGVVLIHLSGHNITVNKICRVCCKIGYIYPQISEL